jgi:hypothetical protein
MLLGAYRIALDHASTNGSGEKHVKIPSISDAPYVDAEDSATGNQATEASTAIRLVDRDTIALACTHEEAFARVVDVAYAIGSVTYLDREGEILECLLRTRLGDTMSLVFSFQGRAAWIEVFLTTEVLDLARHELPTIDQLTELVAHELRQRW